MHVFELLNDAVALPALESIVGNNTTEGTGEILDRKGREAVLLLANVGESGDTLSGSVKIDIKVEQGDAADLSDATDVAADDLLVPSGYPTVATGIFATIDADGEDGAMYRCAYVGKKRYVRMKFVFTGTHTNGTPISASAVFTGLRYAGKNFFTAGS
jgi:hypothetical protein